MERKLPPHHPGKMIKANLDALELSIPKTAEILSMSKQHLYRVAKGEKPITPDLAYRIGKLFGNGSRFWMNLQTQYDLFYTEQDYMTDPKKKSIADNIAAHS